MNLAEEVMDLIRFVVMQRTMCSGKRKCDRC
jgi:hypothetical protein